METCHQGINRGPASSNQAVGVNSVKGMRNIMMKGGADWSAVPAACILIAITTPVTFWSYSKMVQGWQASRDPDLVSASQGSPSAITSASYRLTFALSSSVYVRLFHTYMSHASDEGQGHWSVVSNIQEQPHSASNPKCL